MKYIKNFELKGKIISKEDIINLISNLSSKINNKNEDKIEISANFCDGITILDNNISILDNIYFEKKILREIEISIKNQDYNDRIYITIRNETYGYGYSRIKIETKNETLFNALCNIVQEIIDLMEKQNKIYMLANISWAFLLLFALYLILQILLIYGLEQIFKIQLHEILLTILLLGNPPLLSFLSINYIEKNYPSIQFKFGEKSINNPKKKNSVFIKVISFVLTNIIIPIIISWFLNKLTF